LSETPWVETPTWNTFLATSTLNTAGLATQPNCTGVVPDGRAIARCVGGADAGIAQAHHAQKHGLCRAAEWFADSGPAWAGQWVFKGGTSLSKVFGVIDRFSVRSDKSLDLRKNLWIMVF